MALTIVGVIVLVWLCLAAIPLIVGLALTIAYAAAIFIPALGLIYLVASPDTGGVYGALALFIGVPVAMTVVGYLRHEPNPDSGAYRFGQWASGRLQKR